MDCSAQNKHNKMIIKVASCERTFICTLVSDFHETAVLDKKQTFKDLIICAPCSLGVYREGSPVQFFFISQ